MDFATFWSLYPRKVCRKPAEKAWKSAIKRCPPETIISAVRRYAESRKGQDQTFTCHASTWLNQDRWEDWPAPQAKLPNANVDELNLRWVLMNGYGSWIPDAWVRRAVAVGMLTKEKAEKAGYRI